MRALALALACCALLAQPKVHRFALPNGLRVVHLEDPQRPMVRAMLQIPLEPSDAPLGQEGLAALFLEVARRSGAGDLGPEETRRRVEAAGLRVELSLDPEPALIWQVSARSRDQDRALGALADQVLRLVLDPKALEPALQALRQPTSPGQALWEALSPDPLLRGTPASLSSLGFGPLLAFRERTLRPDRAWLAIHGDLGPDQARRLALLSLGSWAPGPPRPAPPPAAPNRVQPPLRLPGPGTPVALAVARRPPDLDPAALGLLTALLGHGTWLGPVRLQIEGPWLIARWEGAPGPEAPLPRLQAALQELALQGLPPATVEGARAAWPGRQAVSALEPERQLAAVLAEAQGRSPRADQVAAVSPASVQEALRRWLGAARLGETVRP